MSCANTLVGAQNICEVFEQGRDGHMKYLGWEVYNVGGGRMCHTQMGQCACDTLRRWGREGVAPEFSMRTHNIQGRHPPARRTGRSNHCMWVKTEQNARLPGTATAVLCAWERTSREKGSASLDLLCWALAMSRISTQVHPAPGPESVLNYKGVSSKGKQEVQRPSQL